MTRPIVVEKTRTEYAGQTGFENWRANEETVRVALFVMVCIALTGTVRVILFETVRIVGERRDDSVDAPSAAVRQYCRASPFLESTSTAVFLRPAEKKLVSRTPPRRTIRVLGLA